MKQHRAVYENLFIYDNKDFLENKCKKKNKQNTAVCVKREINKNKT